MNARFPHQYACKDTRYAMPFWMAASRGTLSTSVGKYCMKIGQPADENKLVRSQIGMLKQYSRQPKVAYHLILVTLRQVVSRRDAGAPQLSNFTSFGTLTPSLHCLSPHCRQKHSLFFSKPVSFSQLVFSSFLCLGPLQSRLAFSIVLNVSCTVVFGCFWYTSSQFKRFPADPTIKSGRLTDRTLGPCHLESHFLSATSPALL